MVSPQVRREAVTVLMTEHDFGITRACGLVNISRSQRRRPDSALCIRIGEIAAVKRRYGYRRIHTLLRREGWGVNRKRVYRLTAKRALQYDGASASGLDHSSVNHCRSRPQRT